MAHDSDLYEELKTLRSRRGVERPDLGKHVGPEIRRRCGLGPADKEARIRPAVVEMLRGLLSGLSPDLQQAASLGFALERDYRLRTLHDRAGGLAELQQVSLRTARRRMDDALTEMALAGENAPTSIVPPPPNGSGWRMASLRALFRLDSATPELYELRTIVTTREIDEITVRIGLPDSPDDVGHPTVEALFGARIRTIEPLPEGNSYRVVLTLPSMLPAGTEHEFWLRVILPPGQPTWSHYAIVPLNPCESGTVRVRFDPDHRPEAVWLLDAIPYTDLRDRKPGRHRLSPSALGEVVQDFRGLREGYGYGIAWTAPY